MNRLSLAWLIVALAAIPYEAVGDDARKSAQVLPRPRYTMPSSGEKSGWIDLEQYDAMSDPADAGRLLLSEARLVGLDLDDSTRTFAASKPVRLPNETVASEDKASSFMRALRTKGGVHGASSLATYLVSVRRWPTLRERANAMLRGIRFSREVPEQALVMAMRSDQVLVVANLPFVRWIQPLEPEFKYAQDVESADKAYVETMIGDQQVCREDLAECGATILQSGVAGRYYEINLKQSTLACLANRWWVVRLESANEPVDD